MVHFVGAGPGATDLITVRGLKFIQNADVIIYAGSLVNPALLDEAKKSCEIYNSATMTLQQVIDVMVAAEEQGKDIVRLHTGDPSIYGAIREQMDELDMLGISYDVCPGVSALFGAAASLHCEYTLPDISQTVIISRAEGRTPVPEKEQLRSLASHEATLVLYLSSSLSKKVRDELIAGGYAPETSVAVVYKATWPEEKIYRTILQELPDMMEREQVTKTALIIVGDVVASTSGSHTVVSTNGSHMADNNQVSEGTEFGAKKVAYSKSKLYDATFATEYRPTTAMDFPRNIKNVLLIACSKNAYVTAQRVINKIHEFAGEVKTSLKVKCSAIEDLPLEYKMDESVSECVAENFDKVDAIIFVSASGIAVRSIAPLLTHKSKDPAILCMDELGKHVISLVSGHAGGANELARVIAGQIGATEIITTATDTEGKFSVDDYARHNNLVVTDWELAKKLSVAVLDGEKIEIFTDAEDVMEYHKVNDENVSNTNIGNENGSSVKKNYTVLISNQMHNNLPSGCLQLVPKNLILGIGCKKDTQKETIVSAVKEIFEKEKYRLDAVTAVASIDLKKEEQGLVEFCKDLKVPFSTFDADTLLQLEGEFSSSEFVQNITGVDCVCERSAAALARTICPQLEGINACDAPCKQSLNNPICTDKNPEDTLMSENMLVVRKFAKDGVTVAVAQVDVCLDIQDL